jgi:dimethylglycine dehydrogenase
MKTEARVVVIGGGVVGVSTLYHLAKKGWTDVCLIERKELTSGSTWHAAGLLPLFNLSYSVGQIHKYSVKLYDSLEAETGQPVGFSKVSNIRLARTKDRYDEFMYYKGIAETIGVKVNVLTADQVKEIWPLMETDGIVGAIQHPDDGYIQPADLTQALAKGARSMGAEIYTTYDTLSLHDALPICYDEFMYYKGIAETIGVKVNVLTADEVKEIWPLMETDGILGAIQHPDDGYIQIGRAHV